MNTRKMKKPTQSIKYPCLLCQYSNNVNTLYTKNKLSSHQRKFHQNNRIIPHIQQSLLNNIAS
jgi:hypothetical protein